MPGFKAKQPLEVLACNMEISPTGCFLWSGFIMKNGYGMYNRKLVHRLAYETLVGPIGALQVCHACDIRNCFNPDHLFLGTQEANMHDMVRKGRGKWKGRKAPDILLIMYWIHLESRGMSYREIGRKTGWTHNCVIKYLKAYDNE